MKSMSKDGLLRVFETLAQRYGFGALQCNLQLELSDRTFTGNVQGRDYLLIRLSGRKYRCEITPTKKVMNRFTAEDSMWKANLPAVVGYDPKVIMQKALDGAKLEIDLPEWVPVNEATTVRKVAEALLAAGAASAIGLMDGAVVNYLKSHDELFDGTGGKTENVLNKLKAEMPAVSPAYQPSGKTSLPAVLMMLLGCLLAIPGGALVGLIVHTVGALFCGLVGGFAILIARLTGASWLFFAAIFVAAALVFICLFMVMGLAAADIITGMGARKKNRNRIVPAVLTVPASLGAAALFYVIFLTLRVIVGNWASQLVPLYMWPESVVLGICVVGAVIAAVSGTSKALQTVSEAKFCEQCQCYMEKIPFEERTLSAARKIATYLRSKDFRLASVAIREGETGRGATVEIAACPGCGKGYIDLTVKYGSTTWVASSTALDADDMSSLAEMREVKEKKRDNTTPAKSPKQQTPVGSSLQRETATEEVPHQHAREDSEETHIDSPRRLKSGRCYCVACNSVFDPVDPQAPVCPSCGGRHPR